MRAGIQIPPSTSVCSMATREPGSRRTRNNPIESRLNHLPLDLDPPVGPACRPKACPRPCRTSFRTCPSVDSRGAASPGAHRPACRSTTSSPTSWKSKALGSSPARERCFPPPVCALVRPAAVEVSTLETIELLSLCFRFSSAERGRPLRSSNCSKGMPWTRIVLDTSTSSDFTRPCLVPPPALVTLHIGVTQRPVSQ